MERYVWELTHQLAASGHGVQVLCESQLEPDDTVHTEGSVRVVELGYPPKALPRWIRMLNFSRRIQRHIRTMDTSGWVIHSHERTGVHAVTTFHGSSIFVRKKSLLDWASPRLNVWEWLEKREIERTGVRRVVPVSGQIQRELQTLFPGSKQKIVAPIYPGTDSSFQQLSRTKKEKTIGFMGVEWHRKGLDILARCVEKLRQDDNDINLLVAGCSPADVQHLFKGWTGGYKLVGWIAPDLFFPNIDVLALPARKEPFGMVVAEANAAGIPVVVSTQSGIAPLIQQQQGKVVDISNEDAVAAACMTLLQRKQPIEKLTLGWDMAVAAYSVIYGEVLNENEHDISSDNVSAESLSVSSVTPFKKPNTP